MNSQQFVDLVYTWCDSADPVWNAKRLAAASACGLSVGAPANAACRFAGHDELKYSLRSAEKCAPWVRKVFLVVDDDGALPPWLRLDHPKLRIVRHSEILPPEFLPCFCSGTIEHHLARIPDLAETFIYANDDMMFYRPLKASFFFARDGWPYFRFGGQRKPVEAAAKTNYHLNIERADALAAELAPSEELRQAQARWPHHCIDAYRKSDLLDCFARFRENLLPTFAFPFRSPDKVQRILYAYDAIARGHGHFRYARRWMSTERPWYRRLLQPCRVESLQFYDDGWKNGVAFLEKWKPGLFCFNDTENQTAADHERLQGVYESLFPAPSSFERKT